MKKFFSTLAILTLLLTASNYEKGKEIFAKKCSSCHKGYVEIAKLKENFFEKNNTLLNLKAPTVNMINWAITKGPKRIGEEGDDEFRVGEVADFLEDYLLNPNREKSICEPLVMKFYDKKTSLKGLVKKEDFEPLAEYLLFFKEAKKKEAKKEKTLEKIDEKSIISKAKKENKFILIEVSASDCIYCKKMKNEVLDKEDIKELIDKNYIFVELDINKDKLPFGIDKVYQNITPSFFILDKDGNGVDMLVGYIKKDIFENKLKSYLKAK